jgi:radical SAM protein with 4Fe4S-binding SPASM domain
MGLDTIQISIDAKSPEIIEKMVGIANYGQRILNTIHYLGEAGIRVRTNSVLTPINTSDVGNLARYLAELPYVFKSSYTCYARSLYCHKDELFCSLEETEKFKSELDTIKKAFPKKGIFFNGIPSNPYDDDEPRRTANFRNRPMCTANQRSIFVLPDGSVTVCEEIYSHKEFIIGDLNNQSLLEVWNSPRALELDRPDRNKVPDGACRDCVDFTLCRKGTGRCFRDTMKAYGMNHPHWPDPRCPRAPVGNRIT